MKAFLEQREAESLTFQELSTRTGIPIPTLSYWAAKFRREAEVANADFVPVRVNRDEPTGEVKIETGKGLRLIVEDDYDAVQFN